MIVNSKRKNSWVDSLIWIRNVLWIRNVQ